MDFGNYGNRVQSECTQRVSEPAALEGSAPSLPGREARGEFREELTRFSDEFRESWEWPSEWMQRRAGESARQPVAAQTDFREELTRFQRKENRPAKAISGIMGIVLRVNAESALP